MHTVPPPNECPIPKISRCWNPERSRSSARSMLPVGISNGSSCPGSSGIAYRSSWSKSRAWSCQLTQEGKVSKEANAIESYWCLHILPKRPSFNKALSPMFTASYIQISSTKEAAGSPDTEDFNVSSHVLGPRIDVRPNPERVAATNLLVEPVGMQ